MKINLTKKQYRKILKALYLANWMTDAHRLGTEDDPYIGEFDDLEQYFNSFYKEFQSEDLIDPKPYKGKLYATQKLEMDELITRIIDEYDEKMFWEDLAEKLAEKEFYKKYTKKEIKAMDQDEYFIRMERIQEKWNKELIKNGVERLDIKIK